MKVEKEDVRAIIAESGEPVEHLMIARIKDDVYVCCADADAWAAARQGKLGPKHFAIRDLAAAFAPRGRRTVAACNAQHSLRKLIAGDAYATAAIVVPLTRPMGALLL